ncbi:MAG: hypothetical protein CFE21_13585 [Bacteroidetes bacterium B1(2017)]|nr:MAG: hypothetical protein CFE21_13585 [Bacteroidetes bacterium B1(2017)]
MSFEKLSTRQKMINMMYLVLTAMLALNVSAEILKAFHNAEVKMDRTVENGMRKNDYTVSLIAKYCSDLPNDMHGKRTLAKAYQVNKIADEGVLYFQRLKEELVANAGGRKKTDLFPNGDPLEEVANPDNTELHANLLINEGKGKEVKNKINELRNRLIKILDNPLEQNQIHSDLVTPNPINPAQSWESEMFENVPLAGVVAMLSNVQNDIRNTEFQVLETLKSSLTNNLEVVDKLEPAIIPINGSNITLGNRFQAKIFLAAMSSKAQPQIEVNGVPLKIENGYGIYDVVANREGENKFNAIISTTNASGKKQRFESVGTYYTAAPTAVISATKMNVIYMGLENPISVSVPGVNTKDVKVSCSEASVLSLGSSQGNYFLKPTSNITSSEITVKAEVNGRVMGLTKYRIRRVPKPTLMLGSIEVSGPVSAARVRSINGVFTILRDFIYENVMYTPQTWTLAYQAKNSQQVVLENGKGSNLSAAMRNTLSNAKPGDKIVLTNVTAMGPSGAVKIPNSLIIDVSQ